MTSASTVLTLERGRPVMLQPFRRRPKWVPWISPSDTFLVLFTYVTIFPHGQQSRYYFLVLYGEHWALKAKWLPKAIQLKRGRAGIHISLLTPDLDSPRYNTAASRRCINLVFFFKVLKHFVYLFILFLFRGFNLIKLIFIIMFN